MAIEKVKSMFPVVIKVDNSQEGLDIKILLGIDIVFLTKLRSANILGIMIK